MNFSETSTTRKTIAPRFLSGPSFVGGSKIGDVKSGRGETAPRVIGHGQKSWSQPWLTFRKSRSTNDRRQPGIGAKPAWTSAWS